MTKYLILRTQPNDPTKFDVYEQDNQKLVGTTGTRRAARKLVRKAELGLLPKPTEVAAS